MLRESCQVIVQTQWSETPADLLIALHARRSHPSIERYRELQPRSPLAVMLTGTDLYRDLATSADAARSLDLADRIVVLQEDAPRLLAPRWRTKTEVIFHSAHGLRATAKARGRLDCVVVGHLRAEKDPRTLFAAVAKLPRELPIRVRHIGAPLDTTLGEEAFALQAREPRYRFSGAQPHGLARIAMKVAHLLVHPSVVEGGANVVVESITAGTPVVASRISGNVGMLGRDYPGYFEPGDASGLASLLVKCLEDPPFLRDLRARCARRRAMFTPANEARAVRRLVASLLA